MMARSQKRQKTHFAPELLLRFPSCMLRNRRFPTFTVASLSHSKKQLVKLLLELGGALSYPKELRNLFVELLELVDLLKSMGACS